MARPFALAELAAAAAGICLILGLCTTVAGVFAFVEQAGVLLIVPGSGHGDWWSRLVVAALSLSIAMLGPGAWSLDARRFGRKIFEIRDSPGRDK